MVKTQPIPPVKCISILNPLSPEGFEGHWSHRFTITAVPFARLDINKITLRFNNSLEELMKLTETI